jgi:hypothetical protein
MNSIFHICFRIYSYVHIDTFTKRDHVGNAPQAADGDLSSAAAPVRMKPLRRPVRKCVSGA